jgi:hypothetical protein
MRRGICGFYLIDLGLLSNFKSVRIDTLLKIFFFTKKKKKLPYFLKIETEGV